MTIWLRILKGGKSVRAPALGGLRRLAISAQDDARLWVLSVHAWNVDRCGLTALQSVDSQAICSS